MSISISVVGIPGSGKTSFINNVKDNYPYIFTEGMTEQIPDCMVHILDFSKNVAVQGKWFREQNFPEKIPVAAFVNKYDLDNSKEVMETYNILNEQCRIRSISIVYGSVLENKNIDILMSKIKKSIN